MVGGRLVAKVRSQGQGGKPPWRSAPFSYNVRGLTLTVVGQGVGFPLHRCHAASAGFGAEPQGVGVGVGVRVLRCYKFADLSACILIRSYWAQANAMVDMVTQLHAACDTCEWLHSAAWQKVQKV